MFQLNMFQHSNPKMHVDYFMVKQFKAIMIHAITTSSSHSNISPKAKVSLKLFHNFNFVRDLKE